MLKIYFSKDPFLKAQEKYGGHDFRIPEVCVIPNYVRKFFRVSGLEHYKQILDSLFQDESYKQIVSICGDGVLHPKDSLKFVDMLVEAGEHKPTVLYTVSPFTIDYAYNRWGIKAEYLDDDKDDEDDMVMSLKSINRAFDEIDVVTAARELLENYYNGVEEARNKLACLYNQLDNLKLPAKLEKDLQVILNSIDMWAFLYDHCNTAEQDDDFYNIENMIMTYFYVINNPQVKCKHTFDTDEMKLYFDTLRFYLANEDKLKELGAHD